MPNNLILIRINLSFHMICAEADLSFEKDAVDIFHDVLEYGVNQVLWCGVHTYYPLSITIDDNSVIRYSL